MSASKSVHILYIDQSSRYFIKTTRMCMLRDNTILKS